MVEVKNDIRSSKIDNVLGEVQKVAPKECPKCKSFATELSGGVEWNTREYEGSRFDGMSHQIKYKVTNYKL
jgi:phage FluMu protein Com